MNHTTAEAAEAVQISAKHAAAAMPCYVWLETFNKLTTAALDTRPTDWVARFRYGPLVSAWQPLEGGPCAWTRPTNRHVITYPMKCWPIALARTLGMRASGRWHRQATTRIKREKQK